MSYTTIEACRLCASPSLLPLFSLGSQYVSGFVEPGRETQGEAVPIELVLCRNCTLAQLKHTAPQEILYSRYYWYRSGVTATMREALQDITKSIESLVDFQPDDVVLDIGSNDGTLLRSYTVPQITTVGVEPADNLVVSGREGISTLIHDFWNAKVYINRVGKRARVITAIGMFYDLEDPNQFIADVALSLDDNGLFVAQLMCATNMLRLGDVGNLAHEHLEFYTYESLRYLFGRHGMEIVDIEMNTVNGESYRLYVTNRDLAVLLGTTLGCPLNKRMV